MLDLLQVLFYVLATHKAAIINECTIYYAKYVRWHHLKSSYRVPFPSQFFFSSLHHRHCAEMTYLVRGIHDKTKERKESWLVWFDSTWLVVVIIVQNIGIWLEVELNNSRYFFIGSYTNIFQIGKFFSNSKARSSYSPKFGV